MKTVVAVAVVLAALSLAPASAQVGPTVSSPPPPCTEKQPADIVAAWAQSAVPGQSGDDANEARVHPLELGKPNTVSLVMRDGAKFPVKPGGAEQPKQYVYAGIIGFHVPKDGTYRVVTDEGMRVDVVAGNKLVDSTAFGQGPKCSGKFVDFPLVAPYATVTVLIAPRP